MLDVLRLTALAHMLMAVQRPQSKAVLLMRWFTVGIKYVKKKVHFNEIIILKKSYYQFWFWLSFGILISEYYVCFFIFSVCVCV